ncbi:serine protease filzig [Nymphalis io]|uniref:serine protease filzig n=1 Tax=Inachis io TaxID=171585 RepID=UPI002168BF50|nr:serine protease filzig [Nymphalis io]
MTVENCQRYLSDVRRMFFFIVLLIFLDNSPSTCRGEEYDRDGRKLFGGYKITPSYCKASRAAKYNRGSTICMFNHECVQRGGEVVGACMDGFLFGACCQLLSDSQSHLPKGPGVVMTSYLDYPDPETETDDYDGEQLSAWHNSFKPVITPGYRPSTNQVSTTTMKAEQDLSTESHQAEIISEGFNQITNTLLSTPPKDNSFYVKPEDVYTHSSINHVVADTILLHKNGSEVNDILRPSDFNIQISSMQTKPTIPPTSTSVHSPSIIVSTHRPIYKPVFKPKPLNKTTTKQPATENYEIVSTITKDTQKMPELSSINSIIQMLNESTPSMKDEISSPSTLDVMETKSSPAPSTVTPISYSSSFPNYYITTGHYVTLKPTTYPSSTPYVTYLNKKPMTTKNPSYSNIYTTPNSIPQDDRPIKPYYSSPKPSQSTSQDIEAFNRYPTNPDEFGESITTFSYVSSTTTSKPTTTTRKPPSTSYVTGSKPLKRPVTSSSNFISSKPLKRPATTPSNYLSTYDAADSFSSVTPTVIVLNNPNIGTSSEETQFVEISQEPFKKPVSQITVNNHIESTNNIYMGKPPQGAEKPKPQPSYEKPSSPTVVITPKPSPITSPYPNRISPTGPSSTSNTLSFESYTEYHSTTTMKTELQASSDNFINFPPVRNPMLNSNGTNSNIFNTSVSISDNELDDMEYSTPTWQDDDKLNDKMNLFVNKIVGSLQGTFQELHDIVILDKKPNATIIRDKPTTAKPPKKTIPTRKPVTTTRKPARITTTTKKPVKTTKKPVKQTTPSKRTTTTTTTTTTTAPPTTTTKKPVTTTKKSKPTKKVTTTTVTTTVTEQDEVTTEQPEVIDYNDKNLCGVRPMMKSGRIVGGKDAKFGEWPWQVLVRESTWMGLVIKNKCGGVLISNRFVTTAAHCQPGFLASLIAVFGENDLSKDAEPRRPIAKNVRRVIVHRQYDAATFENDLALLELDSPVQFDAHIVPICMPQDDTDFTGRVGTVTGWGRLTYNGIVPSILQEVQVPVIDNSACQEMFHAAGHAKKILNSFICAGYANGQRDSCEGDSGGPLVLQRDDGKWQLVGTVSHGIKCAAPYLPGVYMRTTYYKPWLRSLTGVR